jgi:OmpA-OmpF porin, OOP family
MNRFSLRLQTVAALAALMVITTVTTSAQAAPPDEAAGPFYIGVGVGGSAFGTRDVVATKGPVDEQSRVFKIYGGYQLTDYFGVQAGYTRLGSLNDSFTSNGVTVKQSVAGRSLYVAGTARYPVSDSFAITGKLGISFGKATGTNVLAASDNLIGSKRYLMGGVGGEYRLNRNVALTADYEAYGKLSNKVSADAFTLGARFSF